MNDIMQLFFLILCCATLSRVSGKAVVKPSDVVNYLTTFGYLKPNNPTSGHIRGPKELHQAVRKLQRLGNIPDNGRLDDPELLKLIATPRCGVSDIGPADQAKRRRRRYVHQGSKWLKMNLTYEILNYSPDLKKKEIDDTIHAALNEWAKVTPLTFKRVYSGKADINIKFVKNAHEDGYPFDGPGGTLAHAFYPQDNTEDIYGDAHFDDDETFTIKTHRGIDLFWVAVHEFGHSLGLDHSRTLDAIMYPFYRGYKPNFKLHSDDVSGMQALYGRRTSPSKTPAQTPTPPDRVTPSPHTKTEAPGVPDKCSSPMDAFVTTKVNITYGFKGDYFWPIAEGGAWTEALKIKDFWPDIVENNIDAAFLRRSDNVNFIFKGDKFYMLNDRTALRSSALPITDPELNLPAELANMDAAFQWGRNNMVYFFKGDKYWRYDPESKKIDIDYPKLISEGWRGTVPNNVDAALQWGNGITFIFKGLEYHAINDRTLEVIKPKAGSPYPRRISTYWMGCSPEGLIEGKISPVEGSTAMFLPSLVAIVSSIVFTQLF